VEDSDWSRLISQLQKGDCTPFLGAGACGTLLNGEQMRETWASTYKYPFADNGDLARVMEYAAVSEGDGITLKEKVCNYITDARRPDFEDPAEPHALLAEFPIPTFLTTNYDDFLAAALRRAGKTPTPTDCSWFGGAEYDRDFFETMPGLAPTPDQPLVYHLHGSAHTPKSLVLTESDYLEFLVRITTSRHDDARRIIPSAIFSALTDNPLLFIGYSLQDWTFRVLFHGLIRSVPDINRRRSVSVQLLPRLNEPREAAEERARLYLTRFFEGWRISIFWGSATDFCREVRQRVGGFS
jgi:SIR2-like domain